MNYRKLLYRFLYWLARYRLWKRRKHTLRNPVANHLIARWYATGGREKLKTGRL